MNFVDLQCFLAAVEEMNFTKAAKRLYISQQSLSGHIAKLEEYYGLKLFDRNPPLTLTVAGEQFFQYAQSLSEVEKQARQALQDIKDFRSSDLKIGVSYYRGNVMMPMLLPRFHLQYPNVRLHLIEGTLARITDALYKGKADLILGYETRDVTNVKSEILYEEKTMIVVPDSIFRTYFSREEQDDICRHKILPLEVFAGCPFIKMKKNTWMGGIFDTYCEENDLEVNVVLETTSIATLVSLCVAGMGVIICPGIYLTNRELRPEKLSGLNMFVLEYGDANRKISINFLRNKYHSQASKLFIILAKEIFGENYREYPQESAVEPR